MDQAMMQRLGITQEMLDQSRREMERDQIYDLFCQFRAYAQKHNERYLILTFSPDGAGNINTAGQPGCNEWIAWNDLMDGPAILTQAIETWEKEND